MGEGRQGVRCYGGLNGFPIDVFVIHDATPFGLSLSKP
jgi:hypothetical protein